MKQMICLSALCGLVFTLLTMGVNFIGHCYVERYIIDIVGAELAASLPYANISWTAIAVFTFFTSTCISYLLLTLPGEGN